MGGFPWPWSTCLRKTIPLRVLLRALSGTADEGDANEWVSARAARRLQREDPKRALAAHCARSGLRAVFDVRPIVASRGPCFEGCVYVALAGDELWSDIRRGASAEGVEQAAAASLLTQLEEDLVVRAIAPRVLPHEPVTSV